jgi:hypothetical protein
MLVQKDIIHRHNFNRLVVLKPRQTPGLARSITISRPRAFQQQSNNNSNNFSELKGAAEEAYNRACQILPDLEKAQHDAAVAALPLQEAEAQWQQAFDTLENIKQQANDAITTIRDGTIYSLGGIDTAESALLINHAATRLDQFKSHLDRDGNPTITNWKLINPPTDQKLTWIPGARMVTQLAACTISDVNHVVAVIAVAGPFLEQVLNGLVLHWGVVPHPSSGWAHPPPGWHTHPNISHPTGHVAMETTMAEYAPIMTGSRTVDMAHVFSVVVQLPLQGATVLGTDTAGIKFVLRRTDHQPPEWVKPDNNGDFYCDIAPVAKYFKQKEAAVEQRIAFQKAFEMPSAPRSFDEVDLSTLADGLEDWDWARALGSDDELEEKLAVIKGRPTADAIRASMEEEEREKVMTILEKEVAAVIAASAAAVAAATPAPPPVWMKGVEGWTHVGDEEHVENIRHDGLERKLHHMRCMLEMVQYHQYTHDNQEDETSSSSESLSREKMKQKVGELLEKCNNVESLLQKYDSSELAARVAQQEKERLRLILKEATNTASHLHHELTTALDAARKASVALRGRRTEVTLDDLKTLCHQLAKQSVYESNNNGWWNTIVQNFNPENRTQVFYCQKEMEVAGIDAHVFVQVYMEGTMKEAAAAADDVGEGVEHVVDAADVNSKDKNITTNIIKKKKEPSLIFDTVVMSIVAAEEFPNGRLTSPCNLHLGCVNHQYGQWSAPPSGWWASSAENSSGPRPAADNNAKALNGDDGKKSGSSSSSSSSNSSSSSSSSSIALPSYKIYDKNGQPVFVNPVLYGTSLRMPLKGLVENKSRGVAFVLKTGGGSGGGGSGGGGEVSPERWLSWQHGNGQTADFYVELPHANLI